MLFEGKSIKCSIKCSHTNLFEFQLPSTICELSVAKNTYPRVYKDKNLVTIQWEEVIN